MKTLEQIKQDLESQFHGVGIVVEGTSLIIPKEKWLEIAQFLKTNSEYNLDFLSSVTGVDYIQHMEVVYHIYSIAKPDGTLSIKVRTDRDNGHVPSVVPVWRSAEYQEREIYDLFGIHFDAHPDLRRIFMWEGFEHHPMRKDYVQEDQNRPVEQF